MAEPANGAPAEAFRDSIQVRLIFLGVSCIAWSEVNKQDESQNVKAT
jgi:hypothetical protein